MKSKIGLNSNIQQAINAAIEEKVIPHLQSSLGELENFGKCQIDLQSAGLHRNPETGTSRKTLSNLSKRDVNHYSFTCY